MIIQQRSSISIVALFSGLWRFPKSRGFKHWTRDDSKALMKVYLPAIESHVPADMVCAIHDLLNFCYLVRRDVLNTDSLIVIDKTLENFHKHCDIFICTGVRENWNLPQMHALKHFVWLIKEYGAPNGLCLSMTENKHIKAVKEPWCRSSHYKAMLQMLTTNTCLDKLAASRVNFKLRGMLEKDCFADALDKVSNILFFYQ